MRRTVLLLVATVVMVAMAVSSAFSQQEAVPSGAGCEGIVTAAETINAKPGNVVRAGNPQPKQIGVERGCDFAPT